MCTRVNVNGGPESRYTTVRHSFARYRASASSRPITFTRTCASSTSANMSVEPVGWSSARRTSWASIPSCASATLTCPTVGRPPGEPNTRCTAAATVHPSTTAASRSFGYERVSESAASATATTSTRPTPRVGRVTYGPAAQITATTTATRTAGNGGVPPKLVATRTPRPKLSRDDELSDQPRHEPRDDAGKKQVAPEMPAPSDERCDDHQADCPQRAEAVDREENRVELVGDADHEVVERAFALAQVSGMTRRDHQDHDADRETDPIAGAALQVSFIRPAEQPVPQPRIHGLTTMSPAAAMRAGARG